MPPIMRQLFAFAILLIVNKVRSAEPPERPPSIYEWIEENAHICTSIPADGHNIVNFLTPSEGAKCSLCPEPAPNKVPTNACAVEVSPNEVDVEIGCHPVPELCVLEMRSRYEEFFGGLKTAGTNPTQNVSPKEEDIFMAKSNPFDSNVIASLGRSSQNSPTPATQQNALTSSIPHSSVFLATHPPTTTQIFTTSASPIITTQTLAPTTATIASSPLRHSPNVVQTTQQHRVETTATVAQSETSSDLKQIDADSGDSQVPSSTVRANVFSSPNGGAPIHIAGRLDEIANHGRVSIPMHSTSSTRSPLIGTIRSLNKEVIANEQAKLNPSKSLFEKRTEPLAPPRPQSTSTSRPFTNNSWALFRSGSPPTTTFLPLTRTTRHSLPETQFNRSAKLLSNEEECKDQHQLCCFWAIAGECDTNPFWMRVKCSKTCGTCNCSLREADQCVSTGINCTIPTTTTTILTTTVLTTTPSTTTSTTTQPSTSKLTPPPKFNRFTVKPRNLPPWKKRPLDGNAGPPAFRPNDDVDGSSISNKVQTSVSPITTQSVPFGYADGDSVKATSFVRRPGIQGPASTASVENSLETESTEAITTLESSTSTLITTTTPANCFNYNRLCQFWADLGECVRNPFWMRPHCQLACQSCGETLNDVFAPKAKPNCENKEVLCPFWAFIGECARNPRWMLKNCAPSCQVC